MKGSICCTAITCSKIGEPSNEARRIAILLARTDRAVTVELKSQSGVTLEDDLIKALDELLQPTDPGAAVKNTTETPSPILLDSILPRLPPEGQAWFNSLNPFCRRAVEHDLRAAGPELFVRYWKSLRDTLACQ